MRTAGALSPQPNKLRNGLKGLHVFCSEDEASRTCWLAAFRLFKVRPWHRQKDKNRDTVGGRF